MSVKYNKKQIINNLSEMNNTLKVACFDEITHLICDADKKVNISDVSSNWNISHRDSEAVLLEWIEKNKNQRLNKEFLIRGVDNGGNCVITVLPEEKLDFVQKKFEKSCFSLYSIELASKSNVKRLNVAKINDSKWINLPAKNAERDIVVKSVPAKPVDEPATSKKGVKSMFSASETAKKSEVKQKTEAAQKSDVKQKLEVKPEPESVDIKTEKETPKKQSPKKKEPHKTTKMASGKSSISSFFSKPSSAGVQPKKEELTKPPKKEDSSNMFDDQSSMEVDETSTKTTDESQEKQSTSARNSKKRSIVDVDDDGSDEIPGTPQEIKKAKKGNKKTAEKSKHSRIVKMEDSSDDEGDNRDEQLKLLASPVKEKENKTPPKNETATYNGKRRKAKKTVSRTFKDEEGYLVTKNEIVEYSCSEEETETVPVEPLPPVEDVQAAEVSGKVAEVSGKAAKKKKPSPPSKQGSILSFFSKK